VRVAFQGEPGAYSDEAVSALFTDAEAVGYPTFRLTFEALSMGAVDVAVLPVENSSAGVVQEVSDLLWDLPDLRVVREHVHPVRHCLLGWPGPVERALSHPQALAQCDAYLHSRQIRSVAFHDTAGAARAVAEQRQPGTAAIAAIRAGAISVPTRSAGSGVIAASQVTPALAGLVAKGSASQDGEPAPKNGFLLKDFDVAHDAHES